MSKSLVSPEVVDRFFDRLEKSLPTFVPALPSIILGIIVTLIVLSFGTVLAMWDRHNTKDSTNIVVRTRWIVTLAVFMFASGMLGDLIQNKHYTIRCILDNRQHFANVHWLRMYSRAWAGHLANT